MMNEASNDRVASAVGTSSAAFGSDQYRSEFRQSVDGRLDGRWYAVVNLVVLLGIITVLFMNAGSFGWRHVILLPVFFLVANGIEYFLHRYPMHRKVPGLTRLYEHVSIHHNFYANEKFYFEEPRDFYAAILPVYIFIGLAVLIAACSAVVYLLFGRDDAIFFALVAYGYYLLYEALHFTYHAGDAELVRRVPWIRELAKRHIEHHQTKRMAHYNFNITFPIFDRLMGTVWSGDSDRR